MAPPKFKLPPMPGWGTPPINGVAQFGSASQVPFSGTRTAFASSPGYRGIFGNPGSRSGGGGNPYAGLLAEYLNSTKANFGAQSAADAATRDAALRRYVISYGQTPDFDSLGISKQMRGFLQGALDPTTQALAEKNTKEGTSIYARTKAANDKVNRQIPAMLAGRGMLRSGQTGSDLQEQAQQYKITSFDQLNEMLGGMEGTVGNFLAAERDRQNQLAQAQLQAQMAAMGDYGGDMYGDYGYDAPASGVESLQGVLTPGFGKKKKPRYQAMGPYGPYGPANLTAAQRAAQQRGR